VCIKVCRCDAVVDRFKIVNRQRIHRRRRKVSQDASSRGWQVPEKHRGSSVWALTTKISTGVTEAISVSRLLSEALLQNFFTKCKCAISRGGSGSNASVK
jgi:hypothetical protein